MRKQFLLFIAVLFITCCLSGVYGQDTIGQSSPGQEDYAQQTRAMVSYLEGTLNFLGDPSATVQEKEIVINESYIKIFKDDKIQIEDDLDENRLTSINKDVQAYLKDVDFFFTEARFTFDIQKVEQLVNSNNETYFKVSLMRKLEAKTIANETVSNTRQRFIEINLDPFQKELKIVSYYTTKINEREELAYWWGNMAEEWKEFFGANTMVYDTLPITKVIGLTDDAIIVNRLHDLIRNDSFMVVDIDTLPLSEIAMLHGHRPDTVLFLNDTTGVLGPDTILTDVSEVYSRLKQFTQLKEINISYKFQFFDLEPLSELTDLKLIDFSNTVIGDLSPLRNLNQLDAIYFSSTQVSDLTPLQYSVNIKEIYCFNTPMLDISVLSGFKQLEKLYCFDTEITSLAPISAMKTIQSLRASNTKITDINALSELTFLLILDISNTNVSDISPLKKLSKLEVLNLDNTKVSSLDALAGSTELKTIQFNNTAISSLSALMGMPNIQKVYCERTGITSEIANTFMRKNPGCLVIYETEELNKWWQSLPIYWKAIFSEQANISASPNPEELHEVIGMKALDLSGNRYLQNLDPVSRLINLNTLLLSKTEITDLAPISTLSELKIMDISNTRVNSIADLTSLHNLESLSMENTRVDNLDALGELKHLRLVLADGSRLSQQTVTNLITKQPETLVIYQTEALRSWWNNLPQEWKDIFSSNIVIDINPNAQQLQTIVDTKEIEVKDNMAINSIGPVSKLILLESLIIRGTTVNDLSPVSGLKYLKKLEIPGNPVVNLQPISSVATLEMLNIESTPINDLSPISTLINLKVLNAGGTQVKSLKPLATLTKLEELSIYNTGIKTLSPADVLPNLKQLKCYNTKIKSKQINALKAARPTMNVLYY
jgi:Leucine-rich repeat (LRR) protein